MHNNYSGAVTGNEILRSQPVSSNAHTHMQEKTLKAVTDNIFM